MSAERLYLYVPEQWILLASEDDERLDAYLPGNYDGDDWDGDIREDYDWAISDADSEIVAEVILTTVNHEED